MITMTLTVNFSGIAFGTFDFEVEIVTRNLKKCKWIIYNCESKLIYKGFLLLHQVTGNYPIFLFSFL